MSWQPSAVAESGVSGLGGFTLLDLFLLVVAASFAVSGYRRGLVAGVLAVAGFGGGAALGMAAAPRLVRDLDPGLTQSAVSVLVLSLIHI